MNLNYFSIDNEKKTLNKLKITDSLKQLYSSKIKSGTIKFT